MSLTVKKTLSHLEKRRLRALCRKRNLDAPQKWSRRKLVKRLARSYRDLASVLGDLRRPELIAVATASASLAQTTADQARLHSTGSIGGVLPLDTAKLRADARGACRATVISAYYVCDVLKDLLDGCGEVRVLLNGLGGRRLHDQIEELTELERKLKDSNKCAEIKLAFSRGIFHTKLYLFESEYESESIAWIGSANATKAALSGQAYNEEILLRLAPAPPSLLAYTECAWTDGGTLKDSRPSIDSLTAFFRTGVLYYKPYSRLLRMTYNPFVKLLEVLSPEKKSQLSEFRPPYADGGSEIGAFNIRRVPGNPDDADDDGKKSGSRIMIRSFVIETCYGYWVADPFVKEVECRLDQSSEIKDGRLRELCEWLKGAGRRKTINAYNEYLKGVRQRMKDCKVDWKEVLKKHDIPDPFESTESIKGLIDTTIESLNQKSRRKRLSHAFVSMYVPEFWDDVDARQQFEDTFFGSLAEQSHKRKWPTAAGQLLNAVGIKYEMTPKKIRTALEEKLADPDWYNREFARSDTKN